MRCKHCKKGITLRQFWIDGDNDPISSAICGPSDISRHEPAAVPASVIEPEPQQWSGSGNYVADREQAPQWVAFANGRTVGIAMPSDREPYLVIGTEQPGERRLRTIAAAEDEAGSIGVGGLAIDVGLYAASSAIEVAPQESQCQHCGVPYSKHVAALCVRPTSPDECPNCGAKGDDPCHNQEWPARIVEQHKERPSVAPGEQLQPITDEELERWAKVRAHDAGRLARELIAYRQSDPGSSLPTEQVTPSDLAIAIENHLTVFGNKPCSCRFHRALGANSAAGEKILEKALKEPASAFEDAFAWVEFLQKEIRAALEAK